MWRDALLTVRSHREETVRSKIEDTMYIYKITNKINNKVYIGQTINDIETRWKRHCNDALTNRIDTKFSRAIRKYGPDNFIVEQLDSATSKKELDEKEKYWIKEYNSTILGYNCTDGGEDTSTYKYKTPEEMERIKEKIRETKLGGLNPASTAIKCKNIQNGEELFFSSQKECQDYFKETNHNFISSRVRGRIKYLYLGKWMFAYENENYPTTYTTKKISSRAVKIEVQNLETGEIKNFDSCAEGERYYNLPLKTFSRKLYKSPTRSIIFKNIYKVTQIF